MGISASLWYSAGLLLCGDLSVACRGVRSTECRLDCLVFGCMLYDVIEFVLDKQNHYDVFALVY